MPWYGWDFLAIDKSRGFASFNRTDHCWDKEPPRAVIQCTNWTGSAATSKDQSETDANEIWQGNWLDRTPLLERKQLDPIFSSLSSGLSCIFGASHFDPEHSVSMDSIFHNLTNSTNYYDSIPRLSRVPAVLTADRSWWHCAKALPAWVYPTIQQARGLVVCKVSS